MNNRFSFEVTVLDLISPRGAGVLKNRLLSPYMVVVPEWCLVWKESCSYGAFEKKKACQETGL